MLDSDFLEGPCLFEPIYILLSSSQEVVDPQGRTRREEARTRSGSTRDPQ